MRQRVDQLMDALKGAEPAAIYCVSGDEPLQMLEAEDAIRRRAREAGVEERVVYHVDRSFDWGQLARDGASLSLFSSRRLLELRLGAHKPGRAGGEALCAWSEKPPPDNILIITAARLDRKAQQARWFKAVDRAGVIVQVWPVEPARLPDWIRRRAQAMGRRLEREAAELIAQRTEGNLLAARQELEKLCLLVEADPIRLDDVMHSIVDLARHDVFDLVEHALRSRTDRVAVMLRGLRREGAEPLAVFGALMWEVRRLVVMAGEVAAGAAPEQVFSRHRVWPPARKTAVAAALKRLGPRQLGRLLIHAAGVDRNLKGAGREDAWVALEDFLFHIAGVGVQSCQAG
jgi:DNA polymerase-3 subunit delta